MDRNEPMTANNQENEEGTEATKVQSETENTSAENVTADDLTDTAATPDGGEATTDWEAKYNELNDSYLRLRAEFDNYRKRTLQEKSDLIKNGGGRVLKELLPIVDDFELAVKHARESKSAEAPIVEGLLLIYDKLIGYLEKQGVVMIEATGSPFDDNLHEAVAMHVVVGN